MKIENREKEPIKGLELSGLFYEEYGKPMLHQLFPAYEERIAVGLVGQGSECFGYDDAFSCDHDFEPGFCMWLTKEDERETGFKLFRAYSKLPEEFLGIRREKQSFYGGGRKGVLETGAFYRTFTGRDGLPESLMEWLYLPEHALASAVNGRVFRDELGEFTKIREALLKGYPEDVRLKKIAARAAFMAQSGQYNYERCHKHGEPAAASMALGEFVKNTASMVFLLNNRYMPYYKWMFRAMKELPLLSGLAPMLEELLLKSGGEKEKKEGIEEVCGQVIGEMKRQRLTDGNWDYLEPHGLEVMERIGDSELRNLHLMEG